MKPYRVLAIIGCFTLAIGLPAYALTPAVNGVNDSTYVGYGQTATITAADGSCEVIHNQNPTGDTIFVPGKYVDEWNAFHSNLQQGVTVSACGGCGFTDCNLTMPTGTTGPEGDPNPLTKGEGDPPGDAGNTGDSCPGLANGTSCAGNSESGREGPANSSAGDSGGPGTGGPSGPGN